MTEVINSGVLDNLDKNGDFHEISYSRMGGYGEEQLARQLLETLKAKGLTRDSEDGNSIPMQPMVRSVILVLLVEQEMVDGFELLTEATVFEVAEDGGDEGPEIVLVGEEGGGWQGKGEGHDLL